MTYDVTVNNQMSHGLLVLKGGPAAQEQFSKVLGMNVPCIPNTVTVGNDKSLLWLGPEEWLLIVSDSEEERIASELSFSAVIESMVAIVVSDHYSVITIQGSETVDVLAQACSIDLHPKKFSTGQCCRCAFARTTAIVRPLDSQGTYELIVESSYEQYTKDWLKKAIGV